MKNLMLLALMLALATPAFAGNDNANPCGNNGNNCGGSTANGGAGGDAFAAAGAVAGAVSGSNSSVGDIRNTANGGAGGAVLASGNSHNDNTNVANGGKGGEGGTGFGFGGDAKQGQDQLQGQSQSSKNTNVNGQAQSANSNQTQSSYSGANQSQDASNKGVSNSTVVSFKDERNAPPVYLGNIAATVSCAGGFNAGSSSPGGAGAFGFTWISPDCKQVVAAQNMQSLGMVDVACKIFKSTDGYKRAVKRDPSLADVSCSISK